MKKLNQKRSSFADLAEEKSKILYQQSENNFVETEDEIANSTPPMSKELMWRFINAYLISTDGKEHKEDLPRLVKKNLPNGKFIIVADE